MQFGIFLFVIQIATNVAPSSNNSLSGELKLEVALGSQHLSPMGFMIHPSEFVEWFA